MRRVFEDVPEGGIADLTGNLPPQPAIYPGYPAPILRHGADGSGELVLARVREAEEAGRRAMPAR